MAQAAGARARRPPGDSARPPRRAIDHIADGVGRGRCRHPRVARRCAATLAGSRSAAELASRLADECEGLVANDVLPADVVTRDRRLAETALRPWTPVFIHGDLQVDHVFVAGDEVTGLVDWSEASQGEALFDLATLTLGHPEHLGDVLAGYGTVVDRDLISAWWSLRCLSNVRWLAEHGFGRSEQMPVVAVLRSQP